MHEAKAMGAIVDTVLEHAQQAGGTRVLRVELALGPSDHLTEAVARRHFAALTAGTIAAGAALIVTVMPGIYQCVMCGRRFSSLRHDTACPGCGGPALAATGHDSCFLGTIEVAFEAGGPERGDADASSSGGGHVPE